MKKIILLAIFAITLNFPAFAGDINLDFSRESLKLSDFIKLAYGQILKKNYIFDDSFTNDSHVIKLNLKDLNISTIDKIVNDLQAIYKFEITEKQGVYFFSMKNENQLTTENQNPIVPKELTNQGNKLLSITDKNIGDLEVEDIIPKNIYYKKCLNDCTKLLESARLFFPKSNFTFIDENIAFQSDDETKKSIMDFFNNIDRKNDNYVLKAYFYEYGNSENKLSAVQVLGKLLNSKIDLSLNGTASALTNLISLTLPQFSLLLTNLNNDNRFNLLSNPSGAVTFGDEFRMNVGQQVPVVGQIITNQNGTQQQSVNYRDSGLIFSFQP